ncbi:hypothetical protein NSND_63345 [Nitrospira sp. ND1]|nr:hypothetical protein NSND_63345 [Nitrospira sp. ND1]
MPSPAALSSLLIRANEQAIDTGSMACYRFDERPLNPAPITSNC